ncbi:N-acetyl-D-Glu racemase DgcA [Chthonobacter rhizosphaerae]|uniref:N-acetyl-D-Glu racemase DgcA n=1 Tax=Chthonobacter rhizosphaerae TaxID=2735553 RepID=UPI0015EE4B78|nr:N-acetyl-D-Glu racemase DgcA [Chthonobacter rhizosphaerae]
MHRQLSTAVERWPIAGRFTIARGSKTEAVVVVATVRSGDHVGRGECVPYPRYGETPETVLAAIEMQRPAVEAGMTRHELRLAMPAGAARNAVDCALLDLEAKAAGTTAAALLGLGTLEPVVTAYTLSLDAPDAMRAAAAVASARPLLKIKLGGEGDVERLRAVRAGAPRSRIIVDANEGWTPEAWPALSAACLEAGVALIEQPFPDGDDDVLAGLDRPVPVCADESAHTSEDIPRLARLYDAVNIKLDKTGGLTEAMIMAKAADDAGLLIMAGCMVATSLSMAPGMILAQTARFVDLDGPLLLARDREPGLSYDGSTVFPPAPALWG